MGYYQANIRIETLETVLNSNSCSKDLKLDALKELTGCEPKNHKPASICQVCEYKNVCVI
jgi:hypothetical protein